MRIQVSWRRVSKTAAAILGISALVALLFSLNLVFLQMRGMASPPLGESGTRTKEASSLPGGGEAVSRRGNPTADWRTYTDPTYGYSIKYPPVLSPKTTYKSGVSMDSEVTFEAESGRGQWTKAVIIEVYPKGHIRSLGTDGSSMGVSQGAEVEEDSVNIGNRVGTKLTGIQVGTGGRLVRAFLSGDKHDYILSCLPSFLKEDSAYYLRQFSLMLGTFEMSE